MQSTTTLELNLQYPNHATVMHAVQNDRLSRKISAVLADGATAWTPPTGSLAIVRFIKPDGTMGFYDTDENDDPAVTWTGNVATITLAEQVLTVAGDVWCQVNFYNAGEERLSTFKWLIKVQENVITDETIESTDYFNILTHQIDEIIEAITDMPIPSTSDPLMDGIASPGSAAGFARGDHVHPTDTSRASTDVATTSANGLMSSTDKTKLNGIESGAQVNTITGIKGNAESNYRTGNVNITPENVGAVPTTRTVNGKALSADITLNMSDIPNDIEPLTMESNAINGKAYKDVFFGSYNVLSMLYLDSGTFAPLVVNAGTPVVINQRDPIALNHNALKCFGTSSVQLCFVEASRGVSLTNGHSYYVAMLISVSRYSQGNCGISFGSSALTALYKNEVTDGFVLISELADFSGTSGSFQTFIGTANSANADCLIACPVVLDITEMGLTNETKDALDEVFMKYVALSDAPDFIARRTAKAKTRLAGSIMNASTDEMRFLGMKQLYDIARKKLINPYYTAKSNEYYRVSKGIVCELPNYNTAMYENAAFKVLVKIDESTTSVPASTIKTLNAVTALYYNLDLNEQYTIESGDVIGGSGSAYAAGDVLTVQDLLHAMFLESSNTCANALGTMTGRKILHNQSATNTNARNAFVSEMSKRLQTIGGSAWNGNASGYNSQAVLKPTDLLKFVVDAASFTEILRIWNKKSYTVKVGGTNARNIDITTTVANATLEADYYILGGKTGSTDTANALVLIAEPLVPSIWE